MCPDKPIILVDGSSYLYRAFHALPALTNSKNFPTGAVYGMINMLKRLLADYEPEYMAVIFDSKGKTFRHELYEEYKAHREAMPDELAEQIDPIKRIIKNLGIPLIVIEGVEADDVIGTLVAHAEQEKQDVLVSTGDKDFAQLVNPKVTLINTMTNTILNPKTVEEKFGVTPEQMVDYLTLVGDTSDNIPGVANVGPKTAAKWLKEYGSLDNLILHAEKISGKVGENLRNTISQLPVTKKLVTIKKDIDLSVQFSDLKMSAANKSKLIEIYKEMEFKNWLAELLEENKEAHTEQFKKYVTIHSEEVFKEWLTKLENASQFSFVTETSAENYMTAQLIGVAFAIEPGKSAYLPFGHEHSTSKQLAKEVVLAKLKPLLENPNTKKIFHDAKYSIEILANNDIHVGGFLFDTMMESYVLDSISSNHSLDSLALKYLGWRTITYDEIAGKGVKQIPFQEIAIQNAAIYAAEKADVTLRLHDLLWPKITALPGLKNIFENIETPLISVLAKMERTGVLIDPIKLALQGKELEARLSQLQQEAFELANQEFNINSPKQLQEILFQKLKLPVLAKTPTGQASTADAILQELAVDFVMARVIIEYRSLSKLLTTYTNPLIEQINRVTKRLHTSYNQAGTATGRLSSSDPNLQNIPVRTPEGRRIRQAFIAQKGFKIVSADYSQIELRILAHMTEDENLMKAFSENIDIHKATAAEVLGLPLNEVTSDMRRDAKAINFGLIYGMSAFGLTKALGIERKAAQEYIDLYFSRYPKVKNQMDRSKAFAKENGFVETLYGRRIYIPDIQSRQIPRQKAAERIAINAPLQGSAADIIKFAMIRLDEWLTSQKIKAKMIMQVHDELVFEVHEEIVNEVIKEIEKHMTEVVQLKVPLAVSVGNGYNWDEASAH